MHCGKTLAWYELVPVFSFLIQGGRCRQCKSKLSWQYPAVELLTALVFLATAYRFVDATFTPSVIASMVSMFVAWALLVIILVYDIKHKIIPDGIVYTFAALGLLNIFLVHQNIFSQEFYIAFMAGPILFLPFFLLWLVSHGRWIGLGDAKLALGIGWMLGLGLGVSAIVLAFWIGAAVSILLLVIARLNKKLKHLTMKSEIPFAPYLILGFAVAYFFSIDVMGIQALVTF
jgi:prepilin signal peptidase PulO-like enzyme (type II secretory pathway)